MHFPRLLCFEEMERRSERGRNGKRGEAGGEAKSE